jgi:exodeoxyribonuclease VII small subunit
VSDTTDRDTTDRGTDDRRSFEELVGELEAVTEQLAGGQIGIEQAADLYERAEHLHRLARARLEAVQARVDRLSPPPPSVEQHG